MEVFVISLEMNNEKRRTHIQNEFEKHNIQFKFFNAITPSQLPEVASKFNINTDNSQLTEGELACLFSHLSLYLYMIENNLEKICIFEDDIYLSKDSRIVINEISESDLSFDIIKLEKALPYIKTSFFPIHRLKSKFNLYSLKSEHLGGAGYIISLDFVKFLFENSQISNQPIDILLFNELLNSNFKIWQMLPAVCVKDFIRYGEDKTFPSVLESDRAEKYKVLEYKKSKAILARVFKELLRPFRRIQNRIKLLLLKKVNFYE